MEVPSVVITLEQPGSVKARYVSARLNTVSERPFMMPAAIQIDLGGHLTVWVSVDVARAIVAGLNNALIAEEAEAAHG